MPILKVEDIDKARIVARELHHILVVINNRAERMVNGDAIELDPELWRTLQDQLLQAGRKAYKVERTLLGFKP